MIIKLMEDKEYDNRMDIAALISKNNQGELEAIEGYQELLGVIGDRDKEAADIINEIIADEKNHVERLNALTERYDKIEPNEE